MRTWRRFFTSVDPPQLLKPTAGTLKLRDHETILINTLEVAVPSWVIKPDVLNALCFKHRGFVHVDPNIPVVVSLQVWVLRVIQLAHGDGISASSVGNDLWCLEWLQGSDEHILSLRG
jgi:hypothetical protein